MRQVINGEVNQYREWFLEKDCKNTNVDTLPLELLYKLILIGLITFINRCRLNNKFVTHPRRRFVVLIETLVTQDHGVRSKYCC